MLISFLKNGPKNQYYVISCNRDITQFDITVVLLLTCDNVSAENGNVLFFQLQFGTYPPTFRLDALAILRAPFSP